MSAATDWSLTRETLVRVSCVDPLPAPPEYLDDAAVERLRGWDASARDDGEGPALGVNCCAVCAASFAAAPSACERCDVVKYCGEACLEKDAATHAPICALASFASRLAAVEMDAIDARAAAAASARACVKNVKLLGKTGTSHILGPRGYGERDSERIDADACASRWGAVLKLAERGNAHVVVPKSAEAATADDDARLAANAAAAKTAKTLNDFASTASYPLSVVAASWLFPVVKYALMLGVSGHRVDDDDDGGGDGGDANESESPTEPAALHVVCGPDADAHALDAPSDVWWLLGAGAALDKPGVDVSLIGEGVAANETANEYGFGGSSHTPNVKRFAESYETHAAAAARGPCLVFGVGLNIANAWATLRGEEEEEEEEEDASETTEEKLNVIGAAAGAVRAARRAGCPLLTSNPTRVDVSYEQEAMEDVFGYELVGMARNPFAYATPELAGVGDVIRRNEWLAAYVPKRSAAAEVGGEGAKRSGDDGGGGGGDAKKAKKKK